MRCWLIYFLPVGIMRQIVCQYESCTVRIMCMYICIYAYNAHNPSTLQYVHIAIQHLLFISLHHLSFFSSHPFILFVKFSLYIFLAISLFLCKYTDSDINRSHMCTHTWLLMPILSPFFFFWHYKQPREGSITSNLWSINKVHELQHFYFVQPKQKRVLLSHEGVVHTSVLLLKV